MSDYSNNNSSNNNSSDNISQSAKKRIIKAIKSEVVMIISIILALISCFFVPVSFKLVESIDFRVLALLFCLMLIVAGFRSIDFFTLLSEKLFTYVKTFRAAALTFVMLCFFSSMLITNDVALILFVPFSMFTIGGLFSEKHLILLIVLETIAANLGSMFTPIGNPQNLYLFTYSKMDIRDFFLLMLPYTLAAFIMLIVCTLLFPKDTLTSGFTGSSPVKQSGKKIKYLIFTLLFVLTLTTVVRITPFYITLIICIIAIAAVDYRLFKAADYCLLMTFTGFFIFVGNIGQIESVTEFITSNLVGNEIIVATAISQFISNVPAALLLSEFTDDISSLIVGVNFGGLGTLIASMASLISYKFYAKKEGSKIFTYLLIFTALNIVFLCLLMGLHFLIVR